MCKLGRLLLLFIGTFPIHGCGLATPDKNPLSADHVENAQSGTSSEGVYEDTLVRHIQCEIAKGIWAATQNSYFAVAWLKSHDWGTAATLTITAGDQSNLTPGVSFITPLANRIFGYPFGGNLTSGQNFSFGIGASGSANATRTETIQFTYPNDQLWALANSIQKNGIVSCDEYHAGVQIEGDLKIDQFIYDKATIATIGNDAAASNKYPPFNTFTYDTTFTATLGGNVTPTWKLARLSSPISGTTFGATRTNTNEVIVTIGPIGSQASPAGPTSLNSSSQNQHNAHVQAGANATAINANPPH